MKESQSDKAKGNISMVILNSHSSLSVQEPWTRLTDTNEHFALHSVLHITTTDHCVQHFVDRPFGVVLERWNENDEET